jgi:hypothetical protein
MTTVSVVVADVETDGASAERERAVAALAREVGEVRGEIVYVEGAPSPTRDELGDRYGRGLARAGGTVVAFTDTNTIVAPGWHAAIVDAFEHGARVVGGPVRPAEPVSARSWAGFLLEYGPHARPPFRSVTGDVAANNVAYDAALLRSVVTGAVWKHDVNRALAARGIHPVVATGMAVEVAKHYDSAFVHAQFANAVRYARASDRNIARALACGLLPVVMLGRALRVVAPVRAWWVRTVLALPWLVVGCVAWSAGEAFGYAAPRRREASAR